jgi:glutathione S-transferase
VYVERPIAGFDTIYRVLARFLAGSAPRRGARSGRGRPARNDSPSIADIRFATTLEFLTLHDTPLPKWATDYVQRVEAKLGKAYSEPAADVRGYVSSKKA